MNWLFFYTGIVQATQFPIIITALGMHGAPSGRGKESTKKTDQQPIWNASGKNDTQSSL